MSQQNMNSNKKDPTTDTAYGDPVIASSPTINNDFKKASSPIAESTQSGNTRSSKAIGMANEHANKKKNEPTTETAYGDPVIVSSPTINNEYKQATSTIAESTHNGESRSEH